MTERAAELAAEVEPADAKEFWDAATGLTAIRDWARARRAGPYALLGEVLLQVAGRVPPQVVLPPLGTGLGTQGAASLNQLYASVGHSGLSKGLGHQLGGEIVAWPPSVPAPVYAPLGSGEGVAATYVACQRDENKNYVMVRLASSAVFAATEVDKLAALLTRKNATLGGVLRSVWSGEPIGESNASEERRRIVPRHGYRAGVVVHVQPGRGGALLNSDETAAGTPQRMLWLPAADPDIPDVAPDPPPLLTWTSPIEVITAVAELEARGLDQLGSLDLAVMPVCKTARHQIDLAAVARHRGETAAIDGHALLVREKLGAILGIFLGHFGVTEDDWALAGHLMNVSDSTRRIVADELRRAADLENESRGKSEARRAQIVNRALEAERVQKVAMRIREMLHEHVGWLAGSVILKQLSSSQREYFDDALKMLARSAVIESRAVSRSPGGHGGTGREYSLRTATPATPATPDVTRENSRHPGIATPAKSATPVTS